jgi:hypothetical protein
MCEHKRDSHLDMYVAIAGSVGYGLKQFLERHKLYGVIFVTSHGLHRR